MINVSNLLRVVATYVRNAVQPYFVHLSGQALAWYTVATHDANKWEAAAASAGALFLSSVIKRVNAWLQAAPVKPAAAKK